MAEQEWISIAAAQRLASCSEPTVLKAIANGQLRQRTGLPRGVPSLHRQSVELWAEKRRAEAERKSNRQPRRPLSAPPDDGHDWLTTAEAARVVRRSQTWLVDRAARELAPHVRRGNRLWWRRDQVEAMGAIRVQIEDNARRED